MGRPVFVAKDESKISSETTARYARSPIRRHADAIRDRESLTQLARDELARALNNASRPMNIRRPPRNRETPTYAMPRESNRERPLRDYYARPRNSGSERLEPDHGTRNLPQEQSQRIRRHRPRRQPTSRPVPLSRSSGRLSPHRPASSSSSSISNDIYVAPMAEPSTTGVPSSRFTRLFEEAPSARGGSGVNGLGDRNRSLSPEGVHVWDTLLTSITPDPQPPSLGSSFASTAASQSAAGSAATSFTNPDTSLDLDYALVCESGGEERFTGDEEEDEEEESAVTSGMFRSNIPRSHPSGRSTMPTGAPESINESLEDIMGRIRQLAQRHNISPTFMEEIERLGPSSRQTLRYYPHLS